MSDVTPPPPPSSVPGAPAYDYAPNAPARWNVLSIVGFILAFFVAVAGLIISIIARNQIKKTGERGASLALWGIIVSIIVIVIYVVYFIIIGVAIGAAVQSGSTY